MNDKPITKKERVRISIFKADIDEKTVDSWFRKKGWSPLYMFNERVFWESPETLIKTTKLYGNRYLIYSKRCRHSKKYLYYTSGYPKRLAKLFMEKGVNFSVNHIYVTYEKPLA